MVARVRTHRKHLTRTSPVSVNQSCRFHKMSDPVPYTPCRWSLYLLSAHSPPVFFHPLLHHSIHGRIFRGQNATDSRFVRWRTWIFTRRLPSPVKRTLLAAFNTHLLLRLVRNISKRYECRTPSSKCLDFEDNISEDRAWKGSHSSPLSTLSAADFDLEFKYLSPDVSKLPRNVSKRFERVIQRLPSNTGVHIV